MILTTLKAISFAFLLSIPMLLQAQPEKTVKTTKPYRILTSGKQVTIKSIKDIKTLMVWSATGHRIIEQKNLNTSSYEFKVDVKENYFFLMVQLTDGKVYTEKFGTQ